MTTDLTDKFTGLESQLSTQASATAAELAAMKAVLDSLNTTLVALNNNQATNARLILNKLALNSGCIPCSAQTVDTPALGATVLPISSDQCKRMQAFLHAIEIMCTVADAVSSLTTVPDLSLITNSIAARFSSANGYASFPSMSFPELIQYAGDLLTYAGNNFTVGGTLSGYFSGIKAGALPAISLATSGSNLHSLYAAYVNASSVPSYVKPVLIDMAYSGLCNWFTDSTQSPPISGYDGSICAQPLSSNTVCKTYASTLFVGSGGHTSYYIAVPPTTSLGPTGIAGDYFNWSYRVASGTTGRAINLYYWDTSDVLHLNHQSVLGDPKFTLTVHSHAIAIATNDIDAGAFPFTCEICPPGM